MDRTKVYSFKIMKCPESHAGSGRALINYERRDGTKRFEVVKLLTPSGNFAYAAVVGHWDDPSYMKLDYDLRKILGVELNQYVEIEVTKCGFFGTLKWYLSVADPIVRTSAFLAVLSLGLGVLSLFLAIVPLFQ